MGLAIMDLNLNAINSFNSPVSNVGRNVREQPEDSPPAAIATPAPAAEQAAPPPAAPPVSSNAISATSSALQSQLFDRQREAAANQAVTAQSSNSQGSENRGNSANDAVRAEATPRPPASNPPAQNRNELADQRFSGNPARQAVVQYQANQSLLQDAGPPSGPAISASA